jgi:hypothetical protein
MIVSRSILLRMRNVSDKFAEEITTNLHRKSKHTFNVQKLFSENRAIYEIIWKDTVEPDRPQLTI